VPTVYDCVMAVHDRRADRAIVPIENSLEGSVNATLDTLVFETEEVSIVGEVVHPIQHCLIARALIPLDQIESVASHPQATAQCSSFIRDHLPNATVVSANSTADAVRMVAQTDAPWAAVGNRLSAQLYRCEVLEAGIEDTPANVTRFVWLARERDSVSANGEDWKTSVVFWGLADTPGALVSVLQTLADHGVNLSKIESRPLKQGLGRYMFFADLHGRETDLAVASALDSVRRQVGTLRVLGSYPVAEPGDLPTP
jgi:prephenate dehydratase